MNLTIELTEDEQQRLELAAESLSTTTTELVSRLIRQLLDTDGALGIEEAMDHVLKKNQELYKRLA